MKNRIMSIVMVLFLTAFAVEVDAKSDCRYLSSDQVLADSLARQSDFVKSSTVEEIVRLRKDIDDLSGFTAADDLGLAIINRHHSLAKIEEAFQSLKKIREKMKILVSGIIEPASTGSTSLLKTMAISSKQSIGFFFEAVSGWRILNNKLIQIALNLGDDVTVDLIAFGVRHNVLQGISESDILFRAGKELISVDSKFGSAARDSKKLLKQLAKAKDAIKNKKIDRFFFAIEEGKVPGEVVDAMIAINEKLGANKVGVLVTGKY